MALCSEIYRGLLLSPPNKYRFLIIFPTIKIKSLLANTATRTYIRDFVNPVPLGKAYKLFNSLCNNILPVNSSLLAQNSSS
jgi:hypothetical protein